MAFQLNQSAVSLHRSNSLCMVLETPKGRGIFANTFIPAGSIIETCPVLVLSKADALAVENTILNSYTYTWPDPTDPKTRTQAVILGLGSMFNHSVHGQNVGWTRSVERQVLVYSALRDITADEELCINYGKVWFQDTEANAESDEGGDEMLGKIAI